MQKELNPDLFDDYKSASVVKENESFPPTSIVDPAFLNTDKQIFELRSQMQNLTEQINKVIHSFNDNIKVSNTKFDRLQSSQIRIEQIQKDLTLDLNQKVNILTARIAERKAVELKIQEMVDRHNNVIHNFEVRLGQVQKLLAEKEAQLMTTQGLLNETKMELARLKRL